MWEYIVLGQIPGTHIQVDFTAWVILITIIFGSLALLLAARSKRALRMLLILQIQYVLQSAAYYQWLTNRRHIQA
jgi:hypothetical protein